MEKVIFHIDVNSAFLSWEAVYRLREQGGCVDLREIPCAVGGDKTKRRGIILAKSISAKACGVKTGEPLTDALKKCPGLTVVPAHHRMYREYSTHRVCHLLEPRGVDRHRERVGRILQAVFCVTCQNG